MPYHYSYIIESLREIFSSFGSAVSLVCENIAAISDTYGEPYFSINKSRGGEQYLNNNDNSVKPYVKVLKNAATSEVDNGSFVEKGVLSADNGTLQSGSTEDKYNPGYDGYPDRMPLYKAAAYPLNQLRQDISSLVIFADHSFAGMWDSLIEGGRQARSPFDEVWQSFRNSALKRIGEILSSELWEQLVSGPAAIGSHDKKNTLLDDVGSVVKYILPFLGEGGIASEPTPAIVGDVPEAIIPLQKLENYLSPSLHTSYYEESKFEGLVNSLINKLDEWPKQLQVINNLHNTNNGLKVLNQFLDKYTVK